MERKRVYHRASHLKITASISLDNETWHEVLAEDLSSGGVQISTEMELQKKDVLWLSLKVINFTTYFEGEVKGEIRNKIEGAENTYGVKFIDIEPDMMIRIDEVCHFRRSF